MVGFVVGFSVPGSVGSVGPVGPGFSESSVTVTVTVADLPFAVVAVTFATPFATAVTLPVLSTVTTLSSLEAHVTAWSASSGATFAVSCAVVPFFSDSAPSATPSPETVTPVASGIEGTSGLSFGCSGSVSSTGVTLAVAASSATAAQVTPALVSERPHASLIWNLTYTSPDGMVFGSAMVCSSLVYGNSAVATGSPQLVTSATLLAVLAATTYTATFLAGPFSLS